MLKLFKKTTKKPGLPPGTLVHIGTKKTDKTDIEIIDYNKNQVEQKENASVDDCVPFVEKTSVTWINVIGIHNTEIIERLGKQFQIHSLILEDVVNTFQRPKIEDYDNCIFLVLKMFQWVEETKEIKMENISIICGKNFVISFQELKGDVFDPIRQRIKEGRKKLRESGSDYLTYTLVDAIVDNYFVVLEKIGDKIEELQSEISKNPTSENLRSLDKLKEEMLVIHKSIFPLKEVISDFKNSESNLVQKSTRVYIRDVYDHTVDTIETIDAIRSRLVGLNDVYLSAVSTRTNEVMKMLAIVATIFIPIAIIPGIYGTNFSYLPELDWRWGYYSMLAGMAAIGLGMVAFFKKRKWL